MSDIICAIKKDVENLLSSFCLLKITNFSIFKKFFTEKSFDTIITCKKSRLFEEFFSILLQHLFNICLQSRRYYYRIGALYALYLLYSHQLSQPKIKIRLTFYNIELFNEFVKFLKIHKAFEALYIILSLRGQCAFVITFTDLKIEFCSYFSQTLGGNVDNINDVCGELSQFTKELIEPSEQFVAFIK
uniref:snRNA-activating protein complex subunit 1 (Trinotate prediction) n=1 Tax=Henneguya salminicola TaxID=69463 RepID=A0A6G3MH49_HENSL